MTERLIEKESKETASEKTDIAVCAVICTRNRTVMLRRALQSIMTQTMPPAEILVVDNAPNDDSTRRLVCDEFPMARYVHEPMPGLDFARNRALSTAKEEIIAYMDDDAVADPSWCQLIHKTFLAYPRAGACTGRIDTLPLETEAQRIFEANGGLMAQRRTRLRLPADLDRQTWCWRHAPSIVWALSLGSGCNLSVKRDLALKLNGFDEALDHGSGIPGGGDNDMVWRILEARSEIVYEPAICVRHEHRRELAEVFDLLSRQPRAVIALITKALQYTRGFKRLPIFAFLCWRLLKPGVRLLRRSIGRDPLPAKVLLQMWWNGWSGLAAYSASCRKVRTVSGERTRII